MLTVDVYMGFLTCGIGSPDYKESSAWYCRGFGVVDLRFREPHWSH